MQNVIDEHYKRLAKDYNHYLYYSTAFIRKLTQKMIQKLKLNPNDLFVDLGGGTGMFSLDIHKQVSLKYKSLCVDPYKEMLEQIPENRHLRPLCFDALMFSRMPFEYNKVLIKEAIHHVQERDVLFSNLYERLPKEGRLLLVHVPPKLEYPIFKKALDRALNWHADPKELELQLKNGGFEVENDFIAFNHKIEKEHYFQQVRDRFMTVLSSFSDEEITEGLEEMEAKYRDKTELEFTDHFDFITAVKK